MKPSARRFSEYLSRVFGAAPGSVRLTPLGRGSHGRGYRARFIRDGIGRNVIIKTLDKNIGLGHDYPADRASVFLLATESYGKFPSHVKALDVLSLQGDGALKSIAGGHEYYLIMEEGEGTNYFQDLRDMKGKPKLTRRDRDRVSALAKFLAKANSKKKDAPELYFRKVRDIIGHGECLMGVFDTYAMDNNFTNSAEMAAIEKACVDWRAVLRRIRRQAVPRARRLPPGQHTLQRRKIVHAPGQEQGRIRRASRRRHGPLHELHIFFPDGVREDGRRI